jgi:serine/threonine-protein kinase
MELEAGTVVAERYRIEALLGEGGMGAVYRAAHVHMRKSVALKVLHKEMTENAEVVARFEREAVAASSINHPNIACATDFGRLQDGSFFLVLEYVEGKSLRDVLMEGGRLAPERALKIARGIATALGAAHAKGIVHRDLKPENVMLSPKDGDPDFVKVLDFGIAKVDMPRDNGAQPLTRMGTIFGTPDYMAPEQAMGERVDPRADLYAIGVILFEMLTGERPFNGGAVTVMRQHILAERPPLPSDVEARVGAHVGAVISRLLESNKDARYQTADEVIAALDAAPPAIDAPPPSQVIVAPPSTERVSAISPTAHALPAPVVTAMPLRRPRPLVPVVAVGAGALLLGLLLVFTLAGRSTRASTLEVPPRREAQAIVAVSSARFAAPPLPGAGGSPAAPKRTSGGGRGGGFYIPPPSTWFR